MITDSKISILVYSEKCKKDTQIFINNKSI